MLCVCTIPAITFDHSYMQTNNKELLVSGSDDFTLFLIWEPSKSKTSIIIIAKKTGRYVCMRSCPNCTVRFFGVLCGVAWWHSFIKNYFDSHQLITGQYYANEIGN